MEKATSLADAMKRFPGWELYKDSETEYRCYAPGEIVRADPPAPIPTVSAWQIRKALNQAGLRDQIEAAVASASQEIKDGWEYATDFERDNLLIVQMSRGLGLADAEVDQLFVLAATL